MLVDTAQNPTFYPGVYTLQKQMTSAAALAALQDPANKIDNTVVIPEGLIAADALQRIADATGISIDELTAEAANYTQFGVPAEAPSIEGFLFPATYTFDPGVTAHDVIARMVNETFSRLDALGVPAAERLQVLTLASVIQKESGPDTADMNKISRVFLNRIDEGMPFQSDATVAYGAGVTGTVWTTDEQRADESNIYNTYVHLGPAARADQQPRRRRHHAAPATRRTATGCTSSPSTWRPVRPSSPTPTTSIFGPSISCRIGARRARMPPTARRRQLEVWGDPIAAQPVAARCTPPPTPCSTVTGRTAGDRCPPSTFDRELAAPRRIVRAACR